MHAGGLRRRDQLAVGRLADVQVGVGVDHAGCAGPFGNSGASAATRPPQPCARELARGLLAGAQRVQQRPRS